jgi:hypothetical protein
VRGSFEGITAQRTGVTDVGTVVFEMPHLEQSARIRLELRLLDASGALVTQNHHELYAFPRHRPPSAPLRVAAPGYPRLAARLGQLGYEIVPDLGDADVVVVERMTDELRPYVQQGGRVLWLAESSESQQTHLGPISIAQRQGRSWQGDWASSMSWLRHDKLFGSIPTGGLVDFAFADLTPDAVIVGLQPRDFAGSVHAGLFVGWVHHVVALVAERAVDRGRLVICTFRLAEQIGRHPTATTMVRDMITRLARPGAPGREPAPSEQAGAAPS